MAREWGELVDLPADIRDRFPRFVWLRGPIRRVDCVSHSLEVGARGVVAEPLLGGKPNPATITRDRLERQLGVEKCCSVAYRAANCSHLEPFWVRVRSAGQKGFLGAKSLPKPLDLGSRRV